MPQFDSTQRLHIEGELTKLFALQDRPLTAEKKGFLIEQLEELKVPFGAIMAGIKELEAEDLKSIKLHTIKKAAEKFVTYEEEALVDCKHCSGVGAVTLCDDQKRGYALACICQAGNKHQRLVRWNGEWIQITNGRTLELPERFRN